jgi:hypothetical protein
MKNVKEGFIAHSTGPNDNPNHRNTTKTAARHRGLGSSPGNKKSNNTAKTIKPKKRQFKVGAPTESARVINLPPFFNWQDPKTGQKYRQYPNNHPVFWLGIENPNPNKIEPNRRKPWFVTKNFVLPNKLSEGHLIFQ